MELPPTHRAQQYTIPVVSVASSIPNYVNPYTSRVAIEHSFQTNQKNELALERTERTISLSSFDNNPNASFSYKTNPTMKLSIITPLVFATLSSSISSISGKKISPGVITSQQVSHFSYSCYYSCYDWRMERKSRLPRSASMEQKLCFRLVTYPCLQSRPVASSVPSSYHQHDLPDSKSKRTDLCLSCVSAV